MNDITVLQDIGTHVLLYLHHNKVTPFVVWAVMNGERCCGAYFSKLIEAMEYLTRKDAAALMCPNCNASIVEEWFGENQPGDSLMRIEHDTCSSCGKRIRRRFLLVESEVI